jgi:hypothetical protein
MHPMAGGRFPSPTPGHTAEAQRRGHQRRRLGPYRLQEEQVERPAINVPQPVPVHNDTQAPPEPDAATAPWGTGSGINPSWSNSTCTSAPGSPSATRQVRRGRPKRNSASANRCTREAEAGALLRGGYFVAGVGSRLGSDRYAVIASSGAPPGCARRVIRLKPGRLVAPATPRDTSSSAFGSGVDADLHSRSCEVMWSLRRVSVRGHPPPFGRR